MPASIMECSDFGAFQEAIKNMRSLDDIIINTINTTIPTNSFHVDAAKACKDLHEKIESGHKKRENAIKGCISISAERLKKLREQRDQDSDNPKLLKNLRAEQTKLRMLQVELSVEDLVKQRSDKVFHERCRNYYKSMDE